MNEYVLSERRRRRTLLIVEGKDEKNKHPDQLLYKEDFSDIFLVFDYERHDSGFSEDRILDLQNCFFDSADMGKLFINYPMLESYQHFESLPDPLFENRFVKASINKGNEYKNEVSKTTIIGKLVWFPHKIDLPCGRL